MSVDDRSAIRGPEGLANPFLVLDWVSAQLPWVVIRDQISSRFLVSTSVIRAILISNGSIALRADEIRICFVVFIKALLYGNVCLCRPWVTSAVT